MGQSKQLMTTTGCLCFGDEFYRIDYSVKQ